ncbi:sag-related sequence srs17a [Cystoisospora suis]|uniref:Sag-related sequence srs17a n=1 Tax=Cystoisospora suis TaxID=483139 RepID=A0A2C6L263_9APIC|nr:sag-related sequence srs17a [Cystoisospora suis]
MMGAVKKWSSFFLLTVAALLLAVAGADMFYSFARVVTGADAAAVAGPGVGPPSGQNLPTKVELDLYRLPLVLPGKEAVPQFPAQPQECAYSSKDGEQTSIRLTLAPGRGASFRCPGETDLVEPASEEQAFRLGSDGSCDTSKSVELFGFSFVSSRPGQGVPHKRISIAGWSLAEERKVCYVCKGKTGGPNAGKTCTVFVSVPPATHLTNVANCNPDTGFGTSFAEFPSDEKSSDLSVTFTCRGDGGGEIGLEPDIASQKARTGDYCGSLVSLNEIAEGASLNKIGSTGYTTTYKLTLKSRPKSPRLFCFRCVPPPGSKVSYCAVAIFAPAAKKNGGDGNKPVPDGKTGREKGEIVDGVVTTTKKPTSGGAPIGFSWSSKLMYITVVFSALSAGAGNWLFIV